MTTADGTSRSAEVRAWVAEQAAVLGVSISVPVLCDAAVGRLGVTGVTVTADLSPAWPETRYSTDVLGARLAELQVTVGEGPSLDVWREHGPVLVSDLDTSAIQHRWPLFAPLAVEAGAGALFALPMVVGAIRVGVFALHLACSGQLDQPTLLYSLAFAELAMQMQLDKRVGTNGAATVLELRAPQVHQATGMISAQLDVSMEEAFSSLRARAFADQRPLAELATDVVARRLRFDLTDEAS
jgi:ANTAR domain